MDQVQIGLFIAELRKEQGLTQQQLADRLDISNKTVSKWETGKGLPDVGLMLPLCGLLGISVNELLSGQRLAEDRYREKAEENMLHLLRRRSANLRRIFGCCMILLLTNCIALPVCAVAVHSGLEAKLQWTLMAAALLTEVLGALFISVIDRTTGQFVCRRCHRAFTPSPLTYLKGSWSVLPWGAVFVCPHCGKVARCRRKL